MQVSDQDFWLQFPDDRIYLSVSEFAENIGKNIDQISETNYKHYIIWTASQEF